MKYLAIMILILITGCSGIHIDSEQNDSDLRIAQGIVLGISKVEGQKKLLVTEDVNNELILAELQEIISQPFDEIMRKYSNDLKLIDLRELSEEIIDNGALQAGAKIRYSSENEFLMTHPPTLIAKELSFIN